MRLQLQGREILLGSLFLQEHQLQQVLFQLAVSSYCPSSQSLQFMLLSLPHQAFQNHLLQISTLLLSASLASLLGKHRLHQKVLEKHLLLRQSPLGKGKMEVLGGVVEVEGEFSESGVESVDEEVFMVEDQTDSLCLGLLLSPLLQSFLLLQLQPVDEPALSALALLVLDHLEVTERHLHLVLLPPRAFQFVGESGTVLEEVAGQVQRRLQETQELLAIADPLVQQPFLPLTHVVGVDVVVLPTEDEEEGIARVALAVQSQAQKHVTFLNGEERVAVESLGPSDHVHHHDCHTQTRPSPLAYHLLGTPKAPSCLYPQQPAEADHLPHALKTLHPIQILPQALLFSQRVSLPNYFLKTFPFNSLCSILLLLLLFLLLLLLGMLP